MERKIIVVVLALSIAALSPAPINRAKGARKFTPEQSQAQVAQQQQYNGTVPIVGQVPRVLNEGGMEVSPHRSMSRNGGGENSLAIGTKNADKVGAITQASERVVAEKKQSKMAWFWGLLLAALGFGTWKFVQYKIEKATPVPEFSKKFLKDFENGKV